MIARYFATALDVEMHRPGTAFSPRASNCLPQFKGCARRRVLLVNMMGFRYLDRKIRAERCGSVTYRLRQHRDAEAHVPVVDNRNLCRSLIEVGYFVGIQSTNAADQRFPMAHNGSQNLDGGCGQAEVDNDVGRLNKGIKIIAAFPQTCQAKIGVSLYRRRDGLAHTASTGNAYVELTDGPSLSRYAQRNV